MSNNVIKVPAKFKARGGDSVSYYVRADGKAKTKVSNICYAHHMGQLSKIEMWCVRDGACNTCIDNDMYLEWMRVMKENKLVPTDSEATVENGENKLFIPRGHSKHLVYAALCAYRWSESLAPMVYTVLTLMKERPDISFWQILHYSLAKHVHNYGHSWTYLVATTGAYCVHNNGQAMNLSSSLAFPFFWNRLRRAVNKEKEKDNPVFNSGYTCNAVGDIGAKLAPLEKITPEGKRAINLHPFLIDGSEDSVLDPKWTILYSYAESASQASDIPIEKAGADLKRLYDEIVKNDPKEQAFREKTIKSLTR